MDTSSEYINMCRKATELQNNHVWQDGDYVVVHDNVLTVLGDDTITSLSIDLYEYSVCGEVKKLTPLKHRVWLPRIDQLIELSGIQWDMMMHYCLTRVMERTFRESSAEKCIMNIVMESNHKKHWNGEDWI